MPLCEPLGGCSMRRPIAAWGVGALVVGKNPMLALDRACGGHRAPRRRPCRPSALRPPPEAAGTHRFPLRTVPVLPPADGRPFRFSRSHLLPFTMAFVSTFAAAAGSVAARTSGTSAAVVRDDEGGTRLRLRECHVRLSAVRLQMRGGHAWKRSDQAHVRDDSLSVTLSLASPCCQAWAWTFWDACLEEFCSTSACSCIFEDAFCPCLTLRWSPCRDTASDVCFIWWDCSLPR